MKALKEIFKKNDVAIAKEILFRMRNELVRTNSDGSISLQELASSTGKYEQELMPLVLRLIEEEYLNGHAKYGKKGALTLTLSEEYQKQKK